MSRAIGSGTGQANPATYYDVGQQLCVVLEPAVCGQYLALLQIPYTQADECPVDVQEWLQARHPLNSSWCIHLHAIILSAFGAFNCRMTHVPCKPDY